jgi:hypothetical protein
MVSLSLVGDVEAVAPVSTSRATKMRVGPTPVVDQVVVRQGRNTTYFGIAS